MTHNISSIVAFKAMDAQGKGCDVSGDIRITLEGITSGGIPISTKAIYKVD